MLSNYYIEKLIALQGVIVEKVETTHRKLDIYMCLEINEHTRPYCGAKTKQIHDYRKQVGYRCV